MSQFIIHSLCGFLFLYLGWRIWKKEAITLIHWYHYTRVKEEDKAAYTEEMGKSIIFIGIGLLLSGLIDLVLQTSIGWWLLIAFMIIGFIKIYRAQRKYNGGLF